LLDLPDFPQSLAARELAIGARQCVSGEAELRGKRDPFCGERFVEHAIQFGGMTWERFEILAVQIFPRCPGFFGITRFSGFCVAVKRKL
jgi:hypothetical protein